MIIAKFWNELPNNKIMCFLCPHECKIESGQKGICQVRWNLDGMLYSTCYGQPSAINVDPIEKKPLYHFHPFSKVFSIGTFGCNLSCKFCQNWNISKNVKKNSSEKIISPKDVIKLCKKHNCSSIAFTYNEPTIFAEYLIEISELAKSENIKCIMVTNGFISENIIEEVYKNIDAANVDLKSFSNNFYKKLTNSTLPPVLTTIKKLKELDIWIELTNLVIPTYNDELSEITLMLDWIIDNLGVETPIHFSAFHPDYNLLNTHATPSDTLIKIRDLALNKGLLYVYSGNINFKEGSTTFCPRCQNELIIRGWNLGENNLTDKNKCICGYSIKGVF